MADADKWGERDARRRKIIEDAVINAADRIILDGSDGSVEETDYLTRRSSKKVYGKGPASL